MYIKEKTLIYDLSMYINLFHIIDKHTKAI